MFQCCSAGMDEGAEIMAPRGMQFPMWVVSIRSFLEMASGPPKCHQQLMAEGKLVQWTVGMSCNSALPVGGCGNVKGWQGNLFCTLDSPLKTFLCLVQGFASLSAINGQATERPQQLLG